VVLKCDNTHTHINKQTRAHPYKHTYAHSRHVVCCGHRIGRCWNWATIGMLTFFESASDIQIHTHKWTHTHRHTDTDRERHTRTEPYTKTHTHSHIELQWATWRPNTTHVKIKCIHIHHTHRFMYAQSSIGLQGATWRAKRNISEYNKRPDRNNTRIHYIISRYSYTQKYSHIPKQTFECFYAPTPPPPTTHVNTHTPNHTRKHTHKHKLIIQPEHSPTRHSVAAFVSHFKLWECLMNGS